MRLVRALLHPPPGLVPLPPGYSSGILISAIMLGRVASAYFWGFIADRYGRRPVIFSSLWCTAGFSIAFGFSKTFFWAFMFRFEDQTFYADYTVSTPRLLYVHVGGTSSLRCLFMTRCSPCSWCTEVQNTPHRRLFEVPVHRI